MKAHNSAVAATRPKREKTPSSDTPKNVIGRAVRIVLGPCAGKTGTIAGIETIVPKTGALFTEYRISFTPPIHLASAGYLNAVWLRAKGFEALSNESAQLLRQEALQ